MKQFFLISMLALGLAGCMDTKIIDYNPPLIPDEPLIESSSSLAVSSPSTLSPEESAKSTVNFYIPSGYDYVQATSEGTLANVISYSEVGVRTGDVEPAQIVVLQSRDPRILQYAAGDHPLEPVSIGGVAWQKFRWDGMGETVGYVRKVDDEYIMISFHFPPSEEVMQKVAASLEIF